MQTTIEAALAQHPWHVAFISQRLTGFLVVATIANGSQDGSGHHFRVRHLALSILVMLHGFQHIVTQAKHCYNLAVHAFLRYRFGLSTFTLPENAWIFHPATARY